MLVPPPGRRRVLVVEDDGMVRDTIKIMLEDDYDLLTAASVRGAMDCLGAPDRPAIDVILLDCLLPDGRVADVVAEADRLSIPIMLISGDPQQAERVAPGRSFLPKPFNHASLFAALQKAVR